MDHSAENLLMLDEREVGGWDKCILDTGYHLPKTEMPHSVKNPTHLSLSYLNMSFTAMLLMKPHEIWNYEMQSGPT